MRAITRFALGAAAVIGSVGSAQAVERIENGSFEEQTFSGNHITTANGQLNDWTVTQGNVDLVKSPFYLADTGVYALDLVGTGTSVGGIAQSFDTAIGSIYTLVFSYTGSSRNNSDTFQGGYAVTNGNSSVTSLPMSSVLSGTFSSAGNNTPYTDFSTTFTAQAARTTLSFFSIGNIQNQGIFLDSVSVNSVPEAATWAMMIIGFGAVGSVLRRRRAVRPSLATA